MSIKLHPSSGAYFSKILILLVSCGFLWGCHPKSCLLEPQLTYVPQKKLIESLPSAFERLTPEEARQDWGKELRIALVFAIDMDFYRAITAFKRALVLLPPKYADRRKQIEFSIVQCYYLGNKYQEALDFFDNSSLVSVTSAFPAYPELRLILYDCYQHTDQEDKAVFIRSLIEQTNPETIQELDLSEAFREGDLDQVLELSAEHPDRDNIQQFLCEYELAAKSVKKAQMLNAVLPGAGYYYIGQTNSAMTSFMINALFIWAAWHFFERGDIAAGIITTSLETGWYFGGINGAGLGAKEYNQRLYETNVKEIMIRDRLFPVLMIGKTF
jgi:tetratricopeptide (TPR) repeat protein